MFDDEIEALIDGLGLTADDADAVRSVVRRAANAPRSSAPTVIMDDAEAGPGVGADPSDLQPHTVTEARFEDLGRIASGGMGEVRRVRDRELNRDVALKVLRADRDADRKLMLRFVEEAQTTAQLQHPHIVPVHELGRLPDGRLFFAMNEVRGRTLRDLGQAVHAAKRAAGAWAATEDGWTLRRLVEVFHQVCLAVAYAHSRGVLHRDLKPDNVMVGAFGEVRVMDWGLAKVLNPGSGEAPTVVARAPTREGRVSGTPNYMSREQAYGDPLTPRSDVYSLGAMLFELLTGRPPFVGDDAHVVLKRVRSGEVPRFPQAAPSAVAFAETRAFTRADLDAGEPGQQAPVPAELLATCRRAMSVDAATRFGSAMRLSDRVQAWLEGAERSELARQIVHRAMGLLPQAKRLRDEAEVLRVRAAVELSAIPTWAGDDAKEAAWMKQDRAQALDQEADLLEVDAEGLLRGALANAPGLPEAHVALAERHRAKHAEAERARDTRAMARAEVHMRAHVVALPEDHPRRPELAGYLNGRGDLVVSTEPPDARVDLQRYVTNVRREVPIHVEALGGSPVARRIAIGSYLLRIRAEGHAECRLPVHIPREGRWDAVAPGATVAEPVRLVPSSELGPDDCYVPAGWCTVGGVGEVSERALWVPGFAMRRHPVTNAQYIHYLDDLVRCGRAIEAASRVPRQRTGTSTGRAIYRQQADGTYALLPDEDGDTWGPHWPVICVDWSDAVAYAAWEAERTGHSWRLPSEWEREKAMRGADGRPFPWGTFADPSWARTRYAHSGRPLQGSVHDFPDDESPFGVRGLAGNVLDWCLEDFAQAIPSHRTRLVVHRARSAEQRSVRGGCWSNPIRLSHGGQRQALEPHARDARVGFRLARSVG